MKRYLTIVLFICIHCKIGLSETIYNIDSVKIFGISYFSEYIAKDSYSLVLDDFYEDILSFGPMIKVYGKIVNTSDHDVLLMASIGDSGSSSKSNMHHSLYGTIPIITYFYKGKNYISNYFPATSWIVWDRCLFQDNMLIVGEDLICYTILPAKSSVDASFCTHIFKNIPFNHIKRYKKQTRNIKHNIKEGIRLEQLATNIARDLKVSLLTNFDETTIKIFKKDSSFKGN